VAQRTREIGIRVALGAQRGDVFRMIIGYGLGLSGPGILIGIVAALGMGRILTSFLYGVSASDPLTFFSVSALLAVIAVGASLFPAHRAASINPVEALRME
jgi:ABC-type antimicrobial peptide transport system permease subunit